MTGGGNKSDDSGTTGVCVDTAPNEDGWNDDTAAVSKVEEVVVAGAVEKKEFEVVVEVDVENRSEGRVEGIAETVDNMDVLCGTFAMTTDEQIFHLEL